MLAELPDWKRRVGHLEGLFAKTSAARFPDDVKDEIDSESALIRTGLVALNADLDALDAVVKAGRENLDVAEVERVARLEGLLRRTEARVFAIVDSFLGH